MSDDDDLTDALVEALAGDAPPAVDTPSGPRPLADSTEQTAIRRLREAMAACRTTREMAAHLGVSQATVVRKLKRYGLSRS